VTNSLRPTTLLPFLALFVFTLTNISSAQEKQTDQGQFENAPNTQKLEIPFTPPEQALKMMELPTGFQATLFAAEPDVHQPIAVATDTRGRLWVVECYTYSDRKENFNTNLNDRVIILEDVDHDGKFDKKTVFWDQGKKLTGIELGHGGVWLTAAPNLLFIPDRDFDDIPDEEPTIILNGFEDNVIRHNIVNGLRWGPDGWLYGRHGIQGTSFIGAPDATDSQRVPMNCGIWRLDPYSYQFEIYAQGGTNPWGFDFDEHGEMFMINTVIGHLFHVVPNARYRRMYGSHFNPHLYSVIEQTADHFHWDVSEEHWAVTKKDGMSDGTDAAGGGHAHTGLMIYQGDNWPKEFHNKLFTANFHGRRINSDSIRRQGNSYVASHGPDYFKTADPWFRGVELIYGNDGGVFILDWSDIGECHENDGIHRTSGRIFKITFGKPQPPTIADVRKLTPNQLIELMSSPNQWYVRKALRVLVERFGSVKMKEHKREGSWTNKLLKDLPAAYEKALDVKTQLRLMWLYQGCNAPESWLVEQTEHENEHIRAWAVRLLSDSLTSDDEQQFPILAQSTEDLFFEQFAKDKSGLVRLYTASALGRMKSELAFKVAAALMKSDGDEDDRVQPKLIWYGLEPHLAKNLSLNNADGTPIGIDLIRKSWIPGLRTWIARRLTHEIESHPKLVEALLDEAAAENKYTQFRVDLLTGMAAALNGWSKVNPPRNWKSASEKLSKLDDPEIKKALQKLSLVFGDGRAIEDLKKIAADDKADVTSRRNAIVALSKTSEAATMFPFLKGHLTNKSLTNVVTKAMARCDEPAVAKLILRQFKKMDPEGKTIAINTLVSRSKWSEQLLDHIETGEIDASFVSAFHARQISSFQDDTLSRKLAATWGEVRQTSQQRLDEINQLRSKLTSSKNEPNLENGQAIFLKNCATCHTLFGQGGKVGPDLTGSDRKNLNYLLENIIDPNASVADSFRASVIVLEDGRLLTGVVIRETERTLDLLTKDDETITIDLNTIEERRKTKNSLMPEGLLDNLTADQTTDLFHYLRK
jgi:putative membrane-bound dehydrogenase-like protein